MTMADSSKTVAPHGIWESEITKEAVFEGSKAISSPRVCPCTGRAYFTESRPDGVNYIVELVHKDGNKTDVKDVLPSGYSARSRVYEYGGGPYAILNDGTGGRLIFSNKSDDTVNILDVNNGSTVKKLVHTPKLRYGDFDPHPDVETGGKGRWVLAIEEDHAVSEVPEKIKNYVVAIDSITGEVKRLVDSADLYMYPRFSHDGGKICWIEWDFPDMPWSGCRLFWADFDADKGSISGVERVTGDADASVTEPRWGMDGYLYYCHETTNWRQMYRRRPGVPEATLIKLAGLEDVEFGKASMGIGNNSYTVLSDKCLVAVYAKDGANTVVKVNLETFESHTIDTGIVDIDRDGIWRLRDDSFLLVGTGNTTPQALYEIRIGNEEGKSSVTPVCKSTTQAFDTALFSQPEHIEFKSKKEPSRIIHGFFWPPHNPKYIGPDGKKPPLIVQSHGGPTSHTPPGLNLALQYWNTRGYSTFAINYSGSSGHGKEYRDSLNSNWGILDVDDVAEAVAYLAESGRTDGSLTGIRGGSAGGYSVLQALCMYPDIFAGGVCLYGISEVKLLLAETHKMECRYVDNLMFTESMSEEERQKIMHDRSPVYHAGNITAPLLMLHGDEDKVVPISQADTMYDDIKKRGGEVKLVKFEGEGHGFRKAENLITGQTEEENWWAKTLVKQ